MKWAESLVLLVKYVIRQWIILVYTFLDKTTSFPKRNGLIRNTVPSVKRSSQKKISMISQSRRSGKQKEEKPVEFLQSKTFEESGESERKLESESNRQYDLWCSFYKKSFFADYLIWYLTSLSCIRKRKRLSNRWYWCNSTQQVGCFEKNNFQFIQIVLWKLKTPFLIESFA